MKVSMVKEHSTYTMIRRKTHDEDSQSPGLSSAFGILDIVHS